MSICLYVYISIGVYVYMSICLYVYMSTCPYVYMSTCVHRLENSKPRNRAGDYVNESEYQLPVLNFEDTHASLVRRYYTITAIIESLLNWSEC